ncbi:MAG: hypothetical protein PF513_00320 [Tenericutes bacterium]|jgi:hypothetical protein|nr:hypothetical protein [Mycoplasmatota bacterium]
MKKIVGLLFLLVFAFVGCQNKQLSLPQNIVYDYEGFIIWDEVENADEYLINIEENEFVSQVAVFDITDIITEKGIYDVEIIALADDYESSVPAIFSIGVDYNLNATIDLTIQGDSLIWEPIFLANHYLVSYGFEFAIVDDTSFDLSSLSSGDHAITVQAVFPGGSKTETFTINYTK